MRWSDLKKLFKNVYSGYATFASGAFLRQSTGVLKLDLPDGTISLGDTESAANDTVLSVNDDTETISLIATNVATTLPTVDPEVAGVLWSDAGTVKVSAGA